MGNETDGAKILLLDIECAPCIANVWALFQQDVSLNQIVRDWFILSWAAKWKGKQEVMYMDSRNERNVENDKPILEHIWNLIDEADIIIGQNSKRFDIKKLNARFVIHKMQPPSDFIHIDTYQIARSKFGFTSNKLEYMAEKLAPEHKKSQHKKFPGFELWKECLAGNQEAWAEMELYNKQDVITLEAVYDRLAPWATPANSYNPDLFHDGLRNVCICGSIEFYDNGFSYQKTGKFKRYKCKACGKNHQLRYNEFNKEKRNSFFK